MQIQETPPFKLTREPSGVQHAVKDNIQITILPDAGEVLVTHRKGVKPFTSETSRWLHVFLKDSGHRIFINGTHVVVTRKDMLPTFDLRADGEIVESILRHVKIHKNERGAYVLDTKGNREVLLSHIIEVKERERNSYLSWARHLLFKLADKINGAE